MDNPETVGRYQKTFSLHPSVQTDLGSNRFPI